MLQLVLVMLKNKAIIITINVVIILNENTAWAFYIKSPKMCKLLSNMNTLPYLEFFKCQMKQR